MKRHAFVYRFALVVILLVTITIAAQAFGIGVILGKPTGGLSFKTARNSTSAFDAALSWSLSAGRMLIHADYLHHSPLAKNLPWYIGIGGVVGVGDNLYLGARIPIGIVWVPPSAPIDVFLEIVPTIGLLPDYDPEVNYGLGIRYFL